jgi:hypothetical protein
LTILGKRVLSGSMDALDALVPVSEAYAGLPIGDAFTWQEAGADLGGGEWYLVAFRSVRRAGADEDRLNAYDELAHQEAASAPGFVHYFKGPSAADGSCLSFCLWQSRPEARTAAGGTAHREAVTLLHEMYESYALEFHRVWRATGGALMFEPYDQPRRVPADPSPEVRLPGLTVRPAAAF